MLRLCVTSFKTDSIESVSNFVRLEYFSKLVRKKLPINLTFDQKNWILVGKPRTAGRYFRLCKTSVKSLTNVTKYGIKIPSAECEVIVKIRVGLPTISKHREELKLRGEAEHF